jgi:hypothetical protein
MSVPFRCGEVRRIVSILKVPLLVVLISPVFQGQHPPARREIQYLPVHALFLCTPSQKPIYGSTEFLADCQKDCCTWFFFSAF